MCSKSAGLGFLLAGLPDGPGRGSSCCIYGANLVRLSRVFARTHLRAAVQDQQIDEHVLAPSRARPNQETAAVPSGCSLKRGFFNRFYGRVHTKT